MTRRMLLPVLLVLSATGCSPGGDAAFQGYLEGDYLRIAAPEAGWLDSVAATEGGTVKAGTPLFVLESSRERAAVEEARSRLAQAEADLADRAAASRPEEVAAVEAQVRDAESALRLARTNLQRQTALSKTNVAAAARLDEARAAEASATARLERVRSELAVARLPSRDQRIAGAQAAAAAARAVLQQAEWRLAQRSVAAPRDALVDDVVRRPGEWVPANGTVVSLLPPDGIKVVFFVPEPRRAAVAPGDALPVACTGCPAGLTARVTRLASDAEFTPPVIYSQETRAKLVFKVEALLQGDAGGLRPGQPVTVGGAR